MQARQPHGWPRGVPSAAGCWRRLPACCDPGMDTASLTTWLYPRNVPDAICMDAGAMPDEQDVQPRVYKAFHNWLSVNRRLIKAPHGMTVIYSGWDRRSVPAWNRLNSRGKDVQATFGVVPRWKTIQAVLEGLTFAVDGYVDGEPDPFKGFAYGTMWDFATKAPKHKLLSRRDSQQVWFNLSTWYSKNATGKVWMWVGDTLKEFPDLLLAEIPMLLRNKKIDDATMKAAIKLAPASEKAWKLYQAASKQQKQDGR